MTEGAETHAPAPPAKPVPRWNLVRRLYDWVLSLAESRYGAPALFLLAFAEASFFPVPPDVLLMALALGAPRKAFRWALVCSAGSVVGAAAGYAIGWAAAPLAKTLIVKLASPDAYYTVAGAYGSHAFLAVLLAGFTPIPYKVFTLAAGIFHETVGFGTLLLASLLSRSARFFLVSGLIRLFGPGVKRFIDRWFNPLALVFGVCLVGGFLLLGGLDDSAISAKARVDVHLRELEHADPAIRLEAVEALRALSAKHGGPVSFGYVPEKTPEENREAILSWARFWEEALKREEDK